MEQVEVNFNEIAYSFKPFKILKVFKLFGVNSFLSQNLLVGVLFLFLFLLAAFIDNSFILPGKSIGLLEHPSIWIFLTLQILLPFTQYRVLKEFSQVADWKGQIIHKEFFNRRQQIILKHLKDDVSLKSLKAKSILRILVFIGLMAFIWNSYQNQFPFKFLGFDFWDSINNPLGYWLTRIYKLYTWAMLFPFCLFIQIMVMRNMIIEIKEASDSNQIDLSPFNKSHTGGFNQFITKLINPLWPFFVISGLHALLVVVIQGSLEYTPLIGISIFILILAFLYLLPVMNIRKIIIKEKEKKINVINQERNEIIKDIDFKNNINNISNASELLKSLSYINESYNSISVWPGLQYFVKLIGLAYSPAIISFLIKMISTTILKT